MYQPQSMPTNIAIVILIIYSTSAVVSGRGKQNNSIYRYQIHKNNNNKKRNIWRSDAYIIIRLGLKFRKIIVCLWNWMYRMTSIDYVIFSKAIFQMYQMNWKIKQLSMMRLVNAYNVYITHPSDNFTEICHSFLSTTVNTNKKKLFFFLSSVQLIWWYTKRIGSRFIFFETLWFHCQLNSVSNGVQNWFKRKNKVIIYSDKE